MLKASVSFFEKLFGVNFTTGSNEVKLIKDKTKAQSCKNVKN